MRIFDPLIRLLTCFATQRPRLSFGISLIAALPLLLPITQVKTVKNVDYFTLDNSENIQFYEETKEIFGNDEFFVVAIEQEEPFREDFLEALSDITSSIELLPDVEDVTSLSNVDDAVGSEDFFIVEKLLQEFPRSETERENLKQRTLGNKLFRNTLISEDGTTVCIIVEPEDNLTDENFRDPLIQNVIKALSPLGKPGKDYRIGGWTVTNLRLSEYMVRDISLFIPLSYLLIGVVVFLLFRSPWGTLLSVINVSICAGVTMGAFGLLDIRLNNVTVIVLPLVMALSLCDTVHIFAHLTPEELAKHPSEERCMNSVLQRLFAPCILTSITTAVGFLSLAVSHIPPIKEFAILASLGMIFEFFFSFFFLPPLVLFLGAARVFRNNKNSEDRWKGLLEVVCTRVVGYRNIILAAGALLFFGGIASSSRIVVETDLLAYFRQSSDVRQDLSFIESKIGGTLTLDVVFSAKDGNGFLDPSHLAVIENIQNFLDAQPEVDNTISFVDFLKDMNESFHNENKEFYRLPDSEELVAQYLLLYDSDDIEAVIDDRRTISRLTARISAHSSRKQALLIERLQRYLDSLDHGLENIRITGQAMKRVEVIDDLVSGQIKSLTIATIVIAFLMVFALGSLPLGLLSLLPNMFPIAMNFGLMGLLGIPLNTGTALVSTVALGIAVDDTIHFLTCYQHYRSAGQPVDKAVRLTISNKGTAIVSSSLILCIGFGVLVFGSFVPSAYFGALCAVIMLSALLGDLLFLPALLLLRANRS